MEKLLTEMTQADWDEWKALTQNQVCGVCGNDLTIYTVPEREAMAVGCLTKEHTGFIERETYTQSYRRGALVPVTIQNKIDSRLAKNAADMNRAINLLSIRYPDAIRNPAQASLFIADCLRLGLDPMMAPAEAVPITFKSKKKDKQNKDIYTVTMIVTEDGWLSMAARGCPKEYAGPPRCMPLLDYLAHEHPTRPLNEVKELVRQRAEDLCGDPDAHVWMAVGKRKTGEESVSYGWFKKSEVDRTGEDGKAYTLSIPAAQLPGNQARIRAIKRWVRENFPECRQAMLDYRADLIQRTGNIEAAQKFIDAEYSVLLAPPPGAAGTPPGTGTTGAPGETSGTGTAPGNRPAKTATNPPPGQASGRAAQKTSHTPTGKGMIIEQKLPTEKALNSPVGDKTGEGSADELFPDETTGTKTAETENVLETKGEISEKIAPGGKPPIIQNSLPGGGATKLYIEEQWLKEYLPKAKWSERTAITWLAQFKVDTTGTLIQVLTRCPHDVQEKFVKEVQDRADMA